MPDWNAPLAARLARRIPNLEASIRGRAVLSPADLEAANVNLRHGDPYAGSLALEGSSAPRDAFVVERLRAAGTIPLGKADLKRPGTDVTIVAIGKMVHRALKAADELQKQGKSAEVIDPRTTWPLDKQALIDSAKKTSRALVVDEGYERYGVTAELASVIAEGAFYYLDAPVKRIGAMDVPVPFSPVLEDLTVPNEKSVFEAAKALCRKS